MYWTKKVPTEPNWYWYRQRKGSESVVKVYADPVGLKVHFVMGTALLNLIRSGEWSDEPVPMPEEPEREDP